MVGKERVLQMNGSLDSFDLEPKQALGDHTIEQRSERDVPFCRLEAEVLHPCLIHPGPNQFHQAFCSIKNVPPWTGRLSAFLDHHFGLEEDAGYRAFQIVKKETVHPLLELLVSFNLFGLFHESHDQVLEARDQSTDANQGTDPKEELFRLNRLSKVVVRAAGQDFPEEILVLRPCENQNWSVLPPWNFSDGFAGFHATQSRHQQIENHKIRRFALQQSEGRSPITNHMDQVACLTQYASEPCTNVGFIIHNQDGPACP